MHGTDSYLVILGSMALYFIKSACNGGVNNIQLTTVLICCVLVFTEIRIAAIVFHTLIDS